MITSITHKNTISSNDINQPTQYVFLTGYTNDAILSYNNSIYVSPDTKSIKSQNLLSGFKQNTRISINISSNIEQYIDLYFYVDTYYTPSTWPTLTISSSNSTILEGSIFNKFDTTYTTYVKHRIKIQPYKGETNILLSLLLDLGSLSGFNYYITNPLISLDNQYSLPSNNTIEVDIKSNLNYIYSDMVLGITNLNDTSSVVENVTFSSNSLGNSQINISPILRYFVKDKWITSGYTWNNSQINKLYPSNNDSGIIPLDLRVKEYTNGVIVSGISNTSIIQFSQPFTSTTLKKGDNIKYCYLPNISFSSSNLYVGTVNKSGDNIISLQVVNSTGGSVSFIYETSASTIDGFGVLQTIGNTLPRQYSNEVESKNISVSRAVLNDYDFNQQNLLLKPSKYILTTLPSSQKRKVVKNHLELFSIINDPLNNITGITLFNGSIITNNYPLHLTTNGVDNSKAFQLELPLIADINANVNYLGFQLVDEQEIDYEFEIGEECDYDIGDDGVYSKIFWLNNLGGWESFYFKRISMMKETEVNQYYMKDFNVINNGNKTFYGTTQNSQKLSTGYLNRDLSVWIGDMFNSSQLFYYRKNNDGSHQLIPISIKDLSFSTNPLTKVLREYSFTIVFNNIRSINI